MIPTAGPGQISGGQDFNFGATAGPDVSLARRLASGNSVEMRYFGGMTAEESATALSISVHVVRHELRLAEAWLHKEMAG